MTKFYYILILLITSVGTTWGNSLTDPPYDSEGQDNDTINRQVDGKKEGYWIIWANMRNLPDYKPNDKVEEGNYKSNRKIGMWKSYYPNGVLKSEIEFKNGRASGTFKTYYANGQIEEQGNWKGRVYTGNFKRWYPNGELAQEKEFNETGKTEGKVVYYHSNGQVELEFNTSNGVESGTATRYYPNGDVKEVIEYGTDGVVANREEKERVNPEVKLEEETSGTGIAAEGEQNEVDKRITGEQIEDGYHKTYNENKDILMDGEFKNGKLWNGKHYIYDENGLLERIEVYKDGKYVGNGVL